MIGEMLLNETKKFLDHQTSIEDFSFDLEATLAAASKQLKEENEALHFLLNEDMPELCANYEPDPEQRQAYPDTYFDEHTVISRVCEIYNKAIPLLEKEKTVKAI